MKNKLKFSIVVTFKNEGRHLYKTLECISKQNYSKKLYEIICVDDGSSDDSVEVVNNFITTLIKQKK